MTRHTAQRALVLAAWCVLAAGSTATLAGQAGQATPTPGTPPAQAPVVQFDPKGLGLDEAVRLALQNDPAIQQQKASVDFAAGVVQQERGIYDTTIFAEVFTEYRMQELTESRKQIERDEREQTQEALTGSSARADEAQRLLTALRGVQAAPPGSQQQLQALQAVNASIAAQVATFDTLIATATNATARQQFIDQRNQFLTDSVNRTALFLDQALTDRASAQTKLTNLGEIPVDEVFYTTSVKVGFSKLFSNGIGIQPFIDGKIDGTNFRGKPRSRDFGGKGLEDTFTFHAGLGFSVPLMRGRGATAVAARERAAVLEQDAAGLAVEHQLSTTALDTVIAYWNLRGAQESVEVARASVDLQAKLAELTKALIDAGDLPAIEYARAQATEARGRAQLEDRQRRLHEARVDLTKAMGLSTSGEASSLPTARDGFPATPAAAPATLEALAQGPRKDVEAAVKREAASVVLAKGAETELRSKLDLTGSTYFTALEEKRAGDALDRWIGPSVNVTAEYEKPLGNNAAKGALAQAEADTRTRRIALADLQRQIRLRTLRSAQTLPDTIERLRQTEQSVKLYQNTIQSEVERFKAGESTLIDTLLTQQQYTDAQLSLVAARQDLALLIAQLRFETATLLDNGQVSLPNLTTPPAGAGR
jgi:outer membrane protein TolC